MKYNYRISWVLDGGVDSGYRDVKASNIGIAINTVVNELIARYPDNRAIMVSGMELKSGS